MLEHQTRRTCHHLCSGAPSDLSLMPPPLPLVPSLCNPKETIRASPPRGGAPSPLPAQGYRSAATRPTMQRVASFDFRSSMMDPELPFSFRSSMMDPPLRAPAPSTSTGTAAGQAKGRKE